MKNIVTALLLCAMICAAGSTEAVQLRHQTKLIALKPDVTPIPSRSVFVRPAKYIKPFSTLANSEALAYFDENADTRDLGFPTYITRGSAQEQDTLIGYGEHFTSPLTRTYLDSVSLLFVVTQMAPAITTNFLKLRVAGTLPNSIYYHYPDTDDTVFFPVPNPGRAKDSVFITNVSDYLADDPTQAQYVAATFPMHHKNIGADFYIELTTAYDNENSDFENQNFVDIRSDQNDFDQNSEYDFTTQRCVGVPKSGDLLDYLPFAGISNSNDAGPVYTNLYMVAYVTDALSGVDEQTSTTNSLSQNYPNPFNPSTEINYSLTNRSNTSIKVYNTLGRQVATLVDGMVDAGDHSVVFHADELPSGTYYYTLKAGDFSQTKRLVLAK